jgi:hypothetical protein
MKKTSRQSLVEHTHKSSMTKSDEVWQGAQRSSAQISQRPSNQYCHSDHFFMMHINYFSIKTPHPISPPRDKSTFVTLEHRSRALATILIIQGPPGTLKKTSEWPKLRFWVSSRSLLGHTLGSIVYLFSLWDGQITDPCCDSTPSQIYSEQQCCRDA